MNIVEQKLKIKVEEKMIDGLINYCDGGSSAPSTHAVSPFPQERERLYQSWSDSIPSTWGQSRALLSSGPQPGLQYVRVTMGLVWYDRIHSVG